MLTDDLKGYRLILASRSPRRQELLRGLGLKFEVALHNCRETYPPELEGEDIALYIAGEKADFFRPEMKDNEIIITADTIVWCNNRVLDKPSDSNKAEEILREISDNTHEVITGVCFLSRKQKHTFCSRTRVTFGKLTDEEIRYYIENCRPYDKAGAYGIQEWIGIAACSRIEGSFFNVMGFPSEMVYSELKEFIARDRENNAQV